MRRLTVILLGLAVLTLFSPAAQARTAQADSGLFAIDTVAPVDAAGGSLPRVSGLVSVRPNPFNPRTCISFRLAAEGPAEVTIFDLRGRLVRVVVAGTLSSGQHEAIWDGQDGNGRDAPSGTYLCRLAAGHDLHAMKLLLAR